MPPSWLKHLGKAGEVAASVGSVAGVPYAGVIDSAIKAAKAKGGSGPDKANSALETIMGSGHGVIAALESELGRKIPESAAIAYMQGQIELRYKLLKAAGVV